jgi:hypothetical protein
MKETVLFLEMYACKFLVETAERMISRKAKRRSAHL